MIKKQKTVFVRNPQQLFLLLMLPIILISILSASLSGFISGDTIEIEAKVAVIEQEDEASQIDDFIQEVEQSELSVEKKELLIRTAEHFPVVKLLKEDTFDAVGSMIDVIEISPNKKSNAINNDDYAAVIEIPKRFTYDSLKNILLDDGEPGTMIIHQNEGNELGAAAVKSIVNTFQEDLTMSVFATKNLIDPTILEQEAGMGFGETESIGQNEST